MRTPNSRERKKKKRKILLDCARNSAALARGRLREESRSGREESPVVERVSLACSHVAREVKVKGDAPVVAYVRGVSFLSHTPHASTRQNGGRFSRGQLRICHPPSEGGLRLYPRIVGCPWKGENRDVPCDSDSTRLIKEKKKKKKKSERGEKRKHSARRETLEGPRARRRFRVLERGQPAPSINPPLRTMPCTSSPGK